MTFQRSYYATPIDMGYRHWTMNFSYTDDLESIGPDVVVNVAKLIDLSWQTADWAPELRFWSRPFDPLLAEWLRDQPPDALSTAVALEFAAHHERWRADKTDWVTKADQAWQDNGTDGVNAINNEIEQLKNLLQSDRAGFAEEIHRQADGLVGYFQALVNISAERHPHTMELIRCGLAIGNLTYMHYKAHYKRVRPSTLAPFLLPPMGPPGHPAFPSGHSFLGHFLALLLLKIEPVALRCGPAPGPGGAYKQLEKPDAASNSVPLLWLARRLGKNRERAGLHYATDTDAGRHIAAGVFDAIFPATAEGKTIIVPTLERALKLAQAEW